MNSNNINLLPNNRSDITKNRLKKNRKESFSMRIPNYDQEEEEGTDIEEKKELLDNKKNKQIPPKKNIWNKLKNIFNN